MPEMFLPGLVDMVDEVQQKGLGSAGGGSVPMDGRCHHPRVAGAGFLSDPIAEGPGVRQKDQRDPARGTLPGFEMLEGDKRPARTGQEEAR